MAERSNLQGLLFMGEQDAEYASLRLGEVETRIDGINNRLQDAEKAFDTRVATLVQERDAKLIPDRSDFLMKFKALNELKADEHYGSSVIYIAILTMLTIVIFESIFILILMSDHATIYNLRALDPSK